MATGGALIGALRVSLGLDSASFEAGMKRARGTSARDSTAIAKDLAKIRQGFDNLRNAAITTALVAAGKRALDYASSLGEVAQQLGVTTKELQEYRFAGSQAGISNEEMDKSLGRLTRTIGEAVSGSKAQVSVFRELGVAVQDAKGKVYSAGEVIPKLADALARIKDPATRARLEVDLFGKAGQKLDTLLAGGSRAINELRDAAQKLGIVLSDKQIQDADETADKLDALKQVLEARIAGVVADNAGAIMSLANSFAALANMAAAANRQVPGLLSVLAGATIGGKIGGAPGAAIGAIGGILPALYDRAYGGDPHRVRNETQKNLVARQYASVKARRELNRGGYSESEEFKTLAAEGAAIDAEIGRRLAALRAGKPAPVARVGDGALPVAHASGGAKKTPKDRTDQYLERFNREMAGLEDDQLQLQQQITTDLNEKARLEHERIATAQSAYEFDVDSRHKQGELTAAQARSLKLAHDANAVREHTLVNWKLDDELTEQDLNLTRSRIEKAWDALAHGDAVAVSNWAAEPAEAGSLDHRIWSSHNLEGVLAEKIDGPPRAMRIDRDCEAGTVGFTIVEGGGHSFAPAAISPQLAHDMQWEAAKAFSDARGLSDFTLPGIGPIQTDDKSLTAIRLLVDEARDRIAEGDTTWSTSFLNKDNIEVPVSALDILAINRAVRAFFGVVYFVRQGHRAALKAALEGGATAEQLLAIDITAGYPA